MKNLTKFLCFALTAIMVLAAFAGCGEPGSSDGSGTGADNSTLTEAPTTVPETLYIDTLEKRDLGEREFTVIGQSNSERQNFYMEEKAGDTINEAIQSRDFAVEERLNIKLKYVAESDRKKVISAVQAAARTNDNPYDLVMTSLSDGFNTLTTAGNLLDLTTVPHLTLDSCYWNESMTKNMEMYGKLYFTTGPMSPQLYQTPIVMMANLKIAKDYNLEDPYRVVLEGRWTIDKLSEMMQGVTHDLDGDNVLTENDFWGLIVDPTFGNALYVGAGLEARKFEDGEYRLAVGDEEFVNLVDKCSSLFGDRSVVLSNPGGKRDDDLNIFHPGHALFMDDTVLGVLLMRDMEDDFAVIPCPKTSADQERYLSTCNTWLPSGIGIPATNTENLDDTGLIMETMAVYSYDIIVPAVYEITLRGKISRDADNWKTLDIIFENLSFDFVSVFNPGGTSDILRNSMIGDQENYLTSYEKIKNLAKKELDNFAKIAKNQG
ncbi:MAG: hypothetical protein K5647_03040 [Clostridiales bacterium]|nr:hypothetical protein [Clostridiales bacterium]